jgi:hypothetical protein
MAHALAFANVPMLKNRIAIAPPLRHPPSDHRRSFRELRGLISALTRRRWSRWIFFPNPLAQRCPRWALNCDSRDLYQVERNWPCSAPKLVSHRGICVPACAPTADEAIPCGCDSLTQLDPNTPLCVINCSTSSLSI